MPEKLTLQQFPAQASAVHFDEGMLTAARLSMDPPGEGCLAGAGLPMKKNGDIHCKDFSDPGL